MKNRYGIPVLALAAAAMLVAGCASHRVVVDTKGVDMSRYEQDRRECEAYAGEVSSGSQAAKSAGFGAAVGAAMGAIFGNRTTVIRSAGAGGVAGGAQGAINSDQEKAQVVRNCLRGRGYRVLN